MATPAPDQPKILFVDDEAQARKYFTKAYGRDFEVIAVGDVTEAVAVLETEAANIGVLVTDQRLPGECGVSLLRRVRQQYPAIIRILTTAYSDIDSAIDAVNAGAVFRYVTKPWDIHELRGILLRAMETHQLQRERDALLREKVAVVEYLLLTDRVRSFMVLARSLKDRVENPLHGLQMFLDCAAQQPLDFDGQPPHPPTAPQLESDVWTMALDQNRALLDAVDDVLARLRPRRKEPMHVASLLKQAAAEVERTGIRLQPVVHAPQFVPQLHADASLVRQALSATAEFLVGHGRAEADQVTVSAEPLEQVHGAAGVRFTLNCPRADAADQAMMHVSIGARTAREARLLSACVAVSHHRGRLTLAADEACIDLPAEPADAALPPLSENWMEEALATMEPIL